MALGGTVRSVDQEVTNSPFVIVCISCLFDHLFGFLAGSKCNLYLSWMDMIVFIRFF